MTDDGDVNITYAVEIAPGYPEATEGLTSDVTYSYLSDGNPINATIEADQTSVSNGKRYFSLVLDEPIDLDTTLSLQFTATREDGRVSYFYPDWDQNELLLDSIGLGDYGLYGEEGWSHPLDGDAEACTGNGSGGGGNGTSTINIQGYVRDGITHSERGHVSKAPLVHVQVDLVRNDEVLATKRTNLAGYYEFNDLDNTDDYELTVRLNYDISSSIPLNRGFSLRYEFGGDEVTLTKPYNPTNNDFNLLDVDSYTITPSSLESRFNKQSRMAQISLVYFYGEKFFAYNNALTSNEYPTGIVVIETYSNGTNHSAGKIKIEQPFMDYAYMHHAFWHELSHNLMYSSLKQPYHFGNYKDNCHIHFDPSLCFNHRGRDNPNTEDSWGEGFASFFAILVQKEVLT